MFNTSKAWVCSSSTHYHTSLLSGGQSFKSPIEACTTQVRFPWKDASLNLYLLFWMFPIKHVNFIHQRWRKIIGWCTHACTLHASLPAASDAQNMIIYHQMGKRRKPPPSKWYAGMDLEEYHFSQLQTNQLHLARQKTMSISGQDPI